MKISVNVVADVDSKGWRIDYGLTREEVAKDFCEFLKYRLLEIDNINDAKVSLRTVSEKETTR